MTLALLLASGISLLLTGGHYLVRHAVELAARLNVPALVIGLTIVAFGTSAPELVISIGAVLTDHDDIVIGNIIGSNIANLLLVLAVSAMIFPVRVVRRTVGREGAILTAATALFGWLCWNGEISRLEGGVLLAGLAAYTALAFLVPPRATSGQGEQAGDGIAATTGGGGGATLLNVIAIAASLAALAGGSKLFVDGAVGLSLLFGVPEAVIGLTVVAVGTAAPEIVTAAAAAWNRHTDLAIGNVIGSSIFNLLGIAGVTALVAPVGVGAQFIETDIGILLAASAGVVATALVLGRLGRRAGALLLVAYAAYILQLG
ncbi:MAG: sodium:calcium antiporter [Pseudomonadota bacterium]|nr:sodium:calcium antiporter [Pseudomonadota bacterium]